MTTPGAVREDGQRRTPVEEAERLRGELRAVAADLDRLTERVRRAAAAEVLRQEREDAEDVGP